MPVTVPRMGTFDEERTKMSTLKKGDLVTYVYDQATAIQFKAYRRGSQIGVITEEAAQDWQNRVAVRFEENGQAYRLDPIKLEKVEQGTWVTAPLRFPDLSGEQVTGSFVRPFGGSNPVFMYVGSPMRHARIYGSRLATVQGPIKTETKEEEKHVTDLFGPKPEPIVTTVVPPGPRYTAPFQAVGPVVKDSEGQIIVSVDLYHSDYEPGDDARVAELIRDALNATYGTPAPIPAQKYPGIDGMRVAHRPGTLASELDRLAYEVAPGRFWWAYSAQSAIDGNAGLSDSEKGWAIGSDLIDANTGQTISK